MFTFGKDPTEASVRFVSKKSFQYQHLVVSWLKLRSPCLIGAEEPNPGFLAVGLCSKQVEKKPLAIALQFKLPNGLVIEGCFSSEVGSFIKELSDGLTPLC